MLWCFTHITHIQKFILVGRAEEGRTGDEVDLQTLRLKVKAQKSQESRQQPIYPNNIHISPHCKEYTGAIIGDTEM